MTTGSELCSKTLVLFVNGATIVSRVTFTASASLDHVSQLILISLLMLLSKF